MGGEKERSNNERNPYMASTPGFEPGHNWWEASPHRIPLRHHPCIPLAPPNWILLWPN